MKIALIVLGVLWLFLSALAGIYAPDEDV